MANILDDICEDGPVLTAEMARPKGVSKATVQRCICCWLSDLGRSDWCTIAFIWLEVCPRPNSTQGDLVSRRADPPSQDRRSLGYLVSFPPLATDHESRLHQLAGDAALQPQVAMG